MLIQSQMHARSLLISGLAVALALAACSSTPSDSHSASPAGTAGSSGSAVMIAQADVARDPINTIPTTTLSAAVASNNAFAVDLYAHVLADGGSGNVLTSPISASLALTMTYAGAVGQTATEMATALHISNGSDGSIFAGQNALSQALNARGAAALAFAQLNARYSNEPAPSANDYQMQTVNSIWGEKTYTWEAPFLLTLATKYGTGVYQEDLIHAFEPARADINAWVSSQTNDKIDGLLPVGSLNVNTRMVLVNAIHLKFPWSTAFDPSATQPGTFTRGDGTTVSPDFMNLTTDLRYVDDGQAQIVALPLYNEELSIVIALPHSGVDLATYEATLGEHAAALAQPASSSLIALSLPKASFTSPSFSLSKALQAMGMKLAFTGSADFSGLCSHANLYVADVWQKATVAMQETGVEAAAATAVVIADLSVAVDADPPPAPVPMVVNRPYLVSIVDVNTGAVLMLGHVQDPTDSGGP